jgi:aryl-alcohol dehydrogenase-like predicted oxidoreductase
MSKNNNNTQLWLYVLFTCIFAFSYFISSRYVSTSTSFISVAYLYFNKILYWGTSEWSAQEILQAHLEAARHHLIAPVMEKPKYNMLERKKMEDDYLHLFKHQGLATTIWSPLASGVLSGKYLFDNPTDTRLSIEGLEWLKERNLTEERIEKVKAIKKIADDINVSLPVFGIAWCLKNPNVSTVILGASKVPQLEENLKSIDALPLLTSDVMNSVDLVLNNKPVLPDF